MQVDLGFYVFSKQVVDFLVVYLDEGALDEMVFCLLAVRYRDYLMEGARNYAHRGLFEP